MAEGDLDTQPWEKYKKPAADKPWERYSAPKPPAETTFSGITGAVTRGLAPVATGAALGAAAGIPFAGVGAIPGAAAGAGAVALTELATGLYNPLAEKFGWPKTATPQEMTDKVLDLAGVKRPSTGIERVAESVAGGTANAGGLARTAEQIGAKALSPTVKGVATRLAEKPGLQTVSGATSGLSGQLAAEAGGGPLSQLIASSVGAGLPGVRTPRNLDKLIEDKYARTIKPSVVGKSTASQLRRYNERADQAINTIVDNKAKLTFVDDDGRIVTGKLPQSIEQFADAIDQTKENIFQQFDALQHAAGNTGAVVKTDSLVKELRRIAADPTVVDFHPALGDYATELADRLTARGAYSTADAQRAIQNLNQSLKSFYRNPNYETTARASIDSMVANKLRAELDDVIEKSAGPGYQDLKNQYGALADIEKDVVHRARVAGRQNVGGGLMGNITDVASADEVLRGILTLNAHSVATGAGLKAWQLMVRRMRDPDRNIQKMFEAAEKRQQPVQPTPSPLPMLTAPGYGAIVQPSANP